MVDLPVRPPRTHLSSSDDMGSLSGASETYRHHLDDIEIAYGDRPDRVSRPAYFVRRNGVVPLHPEGEVSAWMWNWKGAAKSKVPGMVTEALN